MPKETKKKSSAFRVVMTSIRGAKSKTKLEQFMEQSKQTIALIKKLPVGSTSGQDMQERLVDIEAEAKAGNNFASQLKKLETDIKTAIKTVADMPDEMVATRPTAPSNKEMQETVSKMGFGKGRAMVMPHQYELNAEMDKVDIELGNLHNAVKHLDGSITKVATSFDASAKVLFGNIQKKLTDDLLPESRKIDLRYEAKPKESAKESIYLKELDTLKDQLSKHKKEVASACDELVKEIRAASVKPDVVAGLAQDVLEAKKDEEKLKQYQSKITETDKKLIVIEDWEIPEAENLRGKFNRATKVLPADLAAGTVALEELQDEIEREVRLRDTKYEIEAKVRLERLAKVVKKLAALIINMQLTVNSDWEKAFNKQTQLEEDVIRNMINNGKNPNALLSASELIDSLEARAVDLQQNFGKMVQLETRRLKCTEKLKDKNCPKLAAELTLELKAFDDSSKSMAPTAAIKAFDAFEAKVFNGNKSLKTLSENRVASLKTFKKESSTIKNLLKTLVAALKKQPDKNKEKNFYKTCQGPLQDKFDEADSLSKEEDAISMAEAMRLLMEVKTKSNQYVTALAKKPEKRSSSENELCSAAAKGQADGVEAAKHAQKDKEAFEDKYKKAKEAFNVVEIRIQGLPEFRGEFKASKDMRQNGKKIAEDTSDYKRATGIVNEAVKRAKKLMTEASRTPLKLKGIQKEWERAHDLMLAAITEIGNAAIESTKDLPEEEAAKTVEQILSAAANKLDKGAFDDACELYKNPNASAADILRMREKTLNKVRLMKERIANDPLLKAAQAHPFKGIKEVISPVYNALNTIEYKVLVNV